jgi:anti-sigma factor RsiW
MRCEDAIDTIRAAGSRPESDFRAATSHVASCDDCQSALRALDAMRTLRATPVPVVAENAIERAIDRALTTPVSGWRRGFWSGLASGAAAAAAIAALAVGIWSLRSGGESSVAVPEVRLVLNRPSDVTVMLDSPEPLANAEVRVELRGAIALEGYAGQRELRWSTDLDRGINQLTLPVVAIDATGGQVLVEVTHGDKRRTFVLDVRAAAAG